MRRVTDRRVLGQAEPPQAQSRRQPRRQSSALGRCPRPTTKRSRAMQANAFHRP
jgi:hypothetical protein